VLMIALVLAAGPSRLRESDDKDDASTQGRIDAWYEGFQFFRSSPIVGIGKGEFTEHHIITAHNSFVLCFSETGFLGYIAWFGTACYVMYGLHHVLKRTRPGTRAHRQTLAIFNALAAFFVGGFFLSRTYFILVPIFFGLAVARFKAARDELAEQAEARGEFPGDYDSTRMPAVDENDDNEDQSEFVPNPRPLPNLSWSAMPNTMPAIVGLAFISMAGIYVLVRLKL
jgi:O-antigen ligase